MALSRANVIERLQPIFDTLFLDPPKLRPDLTAKEVPEWDSLLQITLVVTVESEFGMRFRVGDVEATRNIADFADLIVRRSVEP